jgi:CheY-like chemotaxis protein
MILIVEDDEGQAILIQRNLKRSGIINNMVCFSTGQDAADYIWAKGPHTNRNKGMNFVILLDINLPGMDGIELLRRIKADETQKNIPVILLTTTSDPRDIAKCYELGCSAYVTKPVEAEAFSEAIKRIGLFLQVVSLPREV